MRVLFFLAISMIALLMNGQSVILKDSFDDNSNFWRLRNNKDNQSKIVDGELLWKREGIKSEVISKYMNRLDTRQDFKVEAFIRSRALGSTYGICWGGKDKGDAFYFLVKGQKWKVFSASRGKVVSSTDFKYNFKVSPRKNVLRIDKIGNEVHYFINDHNVLIQTYQPVFGKKFGFILLQNSSIAIDDFELTGALLPINLIPGLEYKEKEERLGPEINSDYDEMTPIITADGKQLYFSRKHHPNNVGGSSDLEDVYSSKLLNGKWGQASNIGFPINNGGPNAVHSVSPDGNTLLTINLYEDNGNSKGQGLSKSARTVSGWSMPQQVKIRQYYNQSGFNEFFLCSDEKVLIMAVQREEGVGSRDLFVSFYEGDGIWSAPKNMGSSLNTTGTEMSPFLAPDGATLYFSSNGHPGYGQNDVFISRRLDDTWSNWSLPQNVGMPVNGRGVDSYYSVPANGEHAYYVSSGEKKHTTDIYRIKLPEKVKPKPVVLIKGVVRNSKTNHPIGTEITYRNLKTDKEAGIAHSNPSNGEYEIVLPLEEAYSFYAKEDSFYSVRDHIDLHGKRRYQVIERDLYLTPMEIGQSVQLHNVLFVRSKAVLLPGSYAELNRLSDLMLGNREMEILISGHTDNTGNSVLNVSLSKDRALAVKSYLLTQGLGDSRIKTIGFGGQKPIADNSEESTRKLNRRVEFEIINY